MYFFKFNQHTNNLIIFDKILINESKVLNLDLTSRICLYFLYQKNLKEKTTKFNFLKKIFFYSRLLEQISSQRVSFQIVSYRWCLFLKDLMHENFESKREIIYSLFTSLLHMEFIVFFYFKKFLINSNLQNKSVFRNLKSYKFVNFVKFACFLKGSKPYIKQLFKQRIYCEYKIKKAELYNELFYSLVI